MLFDKQKHSHDRKEKNDMKTYRITVNGHEMGEYPGENEDEAILAYIRDAGYDSLDDVASVLHLPADNLGIVCEEKNGFLSTVNVRVIL